MSFEQEEIISSTTSARGPMLNIKRRAGSALTLAEEGRGLDTRLSDFCLAMARRLRGNVGILQQWTRISPYAITLENSETSVNQKGKLVVCIGIW